MKIKVCCISSVDEANLALRHGATALGLVSAMPSGPGVITDERIAEIASSVNGRADTFLLTSKVEPQLIVEQVRDAGVTTVQLVDSLEIHALKELQRQLTDVTVVQVVHVTDESSVEESLRAAEIADALLLDSGNQQLTVKELGGTGRTHNWEISAAIVDQVSVPVYLAGGLRADNVGRAISLVKPHGVDLCSGVRTEGKLDERKLQAFVGAVRG